MTSHALCGRLYSRSVPVAVMFLCWFSLVGVYSAFGQDAQLNGTVTDPSKKAVANASVEIVNSATQGVWKTQTNGEGFFVSPALAPAEYKITIQAPGFKTNVVESVKLDVDAKVSIDFVLEVGSVTETVTVNGSGVYVNTTDAAVSTELDHQFVENLPLNGRSFESLLTAVPGVYEAFSQGAGISGEMSVNGQRTEENYYTVDGVSASNGAACGTCGPGYGAGYSGQVPSSTSIGSTQSIIPVDALQEFRATTSNYSAEYGRTPGGQFSFTTRSGTNDWHGSVFEYLRNSEFDANDWFSDHAGIAKPAERTNDFGVTLGGPVRIPGLYNGEGKTFFFFSYEGLRLVLPVATNTYAVPDLCFRGMAPATGPTSCAAVSAILGPGAEPVAPAAAALMPFINAYPLPTSTSIELGDGEATYPAAYSVPSTINSYGIRVDHNVRDSFKIFGRYSYVPSSSTSRDQGDGDLAVLNVTSNSTRSITLGATNQFTPYLTNDLRFNFTRSINSYSGQPTTFGGASIPDLSAIPGFAPYDIFYFQLAYDFYPGFQFNPVNVMQDQINLVDSVTRTVGRHTFKAGVDYRRTYTSETLPPHEEYGLFGDPLSVENNTPFYNQLRVPNAPTMDPIYKNVSLFVQDEWKVTPRLSLSLGLRWELNPAPTDAKHLGPYAVNQITDLATLTLTSANAPLWATTYHNFAPRIGVAYQVRQAPGWETVVRGGFGIFYDTGNSLGSSGYNGAGDKNAVFFNGPYPLTQAQINSVGPPNTSTPYGYQVIAIDPHLKMPYTYEWNLAVQQALGRNQTLTLTYVGNSGRNLLIQKLLFPDTPSFSGGNGLYTVDNSGLSNYNALQATFQRKLAKGLQALFSYTLEHSLDNQSSNFLIFDDAYSDSDFDIRHNFQGSLTYDCPGKYENKFAAAVLEFWSVDSRIYAHSARPVEIYSGFGTAGDSADTAFYPNRVSGQPLWVANPNAPGGKVINYKAFVPVFNSMGNLINGDAGRNAARGFPAVQDDLAIRREFPIKERLRLQFRVEAFNIFNHPAFGNFNNSLTNGPNFFGLATSSQNSNQGSLTPLFNVGGPRTLQFALKLRF
jgi:carboxypeptidase family protein/TonB-dependent receptor-like protein